MNSVLSPTTRTPVRSLLILLALALLGSVLTACGNGSSNSTAVVVTGMLRGTQERPTQVATAATGSATATLNSTQTGFHLEIDTSALVGVTSAEIHYGKPGANGPVIFPLYTAATTNKFPSRFTADIAAGNLTPQSAVGINTFGDALNALVAGNIYINISTQANSTGELRGQLGAASITVTPTGSAVVPPVTSTLTNLSATAAFNAKQTVLTVSVTGQSTAGQNLQSITAIGIYYSPPGGNGPQLFSIFNSSTDGAFPGSVVRTLTMTDLKVNPTIGINTFPDVVNAVLSGNAYILISTSAHTGGELRAQLTSQ